MQLMLSVKDVEEGRPASEIVTNDVSVLSGDNLLNSGRQRSFTDNRCLPAELGESSCDQL